jgi:hypothetical protein
MNTQMMFAHISLLPHYGRAWPFFVLGLLILFIALVMASASKDKTK